MARLRLIFEGLRALMSEHAPVEVAIERVFVSRNVDSALKLGQARGAALCAVPQGIPVFEYAPRAIKLAVVGSGAAEKLQVAHMIRTLLALSERPGADAADALAVAVCHAHTRTLGLLAQGAAGRPPAGTPMIGSLRGRIASKAPPQLTVEVAGVGYELEAPMSTFFHLPAVGAEVHLLTHLVVREDAHILYGFATEDERRLFRTLIKVSGVGPKIALALLSGVSVADFNQSVQAQDISALTRVPGIGRKTAERLIVEMRDRLVAPQLAGGAAGEGGRRESLRRGLRCPRRAAATGRPRRPACSKPQVPVHTRPRN